MVDGDLFVVGVEIAGDSVEVVIDGDRNVTVEDCVRISKLIESRYDRDVEDYSLTVISAGVGSPLVHERQYKKLLGKPVEVQLVSGKKRVGLLRGYGSEVIIDDESYPMDEIKTVREHLTFS